MMMQRCFRPTSTRRRSAGRKGTIIPMLALLLVVLCGFLALAIDVGMLAIAKTQAQNAADLAALTAARTLNGNSSLSPYNNSQASTNAAAILTHNNILQQKINTSGGTSTSNTYQAGQLSLTYGSYAYNQSSQTFNASYPPIAGQPWTAVAATVSANNLPAVFSTVLGMQFLPAITSSSQAVHRPRDIALVMDLSASMRFGTCLGFDFYTQKRTTNNPDTNVPTFAQYSGGNAAAYLIGPNTVRTSALDNYTISQSNTTTTNSSYTLTYINSFYQNAAYASTLTRAFDSYTSTDGGNTWTAPAAGSYPQLPSSSYGTTPGGDVPLIQYGSATTPPKYAQTLNQVLNASSTNTAADILWQLDGYSAYAGGKPDTSGANGTPQVWAQADYSAPSSPPVNGSLPFNGYTQGPGYYGVTFFMWPPDPRTTTALSGTSLQAYLIALGISSNKVGAQTQSDATTLSNIWPTWQAAGSAGLTKLKSWLNGGTAASTGAAYAASVNYLTTNTTVPTTNWSGKWNGSTPTTLPLTYYAVCRLFNRAYPGGAAWTSTAFSADWRMRFFGTTTDNTVIFNSSGSLNPPGTSGMWPGAANSAASTLMTYNAILSWLSSLPASANPFPAMLRSGRIKYYGSMPNGTTTPITNSWPSYGGTDQRFWVEVIDHMLGFRQTASASYTDYTGNQSSTNQMTGYGGDITWGTETTNSIPSVSGTTLPPYMNYKDNPLRPLLRAWFSPILMVDYMHNCNYYENGVSGWYNMQPGNAYEAPIYVAKQAYLAAISTMENNHPNDWFSMMSYAQPRQNATDTAGRLNCVSCPLGTNYAYASSSILFPFSTINADGSCNLTEVTPYDPDPATSAIPSSNFVDTNRAQGDTCFAMGLMLAYNQFITTPSTDTNLRTYVTSSPITFPTGMAGGMGRKGAQKVVIFETDGIANCYASANMSTFGTGSSAYSYYKIRYNMNNPSSSEYPSVSPSTITDTGVMTAVNSLVSMMATQYGTPRNPFALYAIGFGPVFSGSDASLGIGNLVSMQNTANGTSLTTLPSNQIITGTGPAMSAAMVSAYTSILESGVQIALIQ